MRPLFVALLWAILAAAAVAAEESPLPAAEAHFLDYLDADSAVGIIDSGFVTRYEDRDRASWDAQRREQLALLNEWFEVMHKMRLPAQDYPVISAMAVTIGEHDDPSAAVANAPDAPGCADASRPDLDSAELSAALVGCFRELGNNMRFEGRRIDRGTALQLLHDIEEPGRRRALFDAFLPLWQALNGRNEAGSPWRRMIAWSSLTQRKHGTTPLETASRATGVMTTDIEAWLLAILDAWREANPGPMIEPWDYRYEIGKANRMLAQRLPTSDLLPINRRFFADLGADLEGLQVLFDLEERPDKSPLAYSDFQKRGRMTDAGWQRPQARVVGRYPEGGLFSINELVHESGHAAHVSAIRTRPGYMDWPDTLFVEAFADVPSWSVYEPAWQRKYLGASVPEPDSLRALHGLTALDVAWSLFEIRMLRKPKSDPNQVWTEITSHYLRIQPHPELSWWAMRVQLASRPGYMVNYGLGAVLTAEIRRRTAEAIGPFDAGNPGWYGWLSERLLRYGSERNTESLMQELLGRPLSPEALLAEIRRIRK